MSDKLVVIGRITLKGPSEGTMMTMCIAARSEFHLDMNPPLTSDGMFSVMHLYGLVSREPGNLPGDIEHFLNGWKNFIASYNIQVFQVDGPSKTYYQHFKPPTPT